MEKGEQMSDVVCNRCHNANVRAFIDEGTSWCEKCHDHQMRIDSEENAFEHLQHIYENIALMDEDCFYCGEELDADRSFFVGTLKRLAWVFGKYKAKHLDANDNTIVCDKHFSGKTLDFAAMLTELDVLYDTAPWVKVE